MILAYTYYPRTKIFESSFEYTTNYTFTEDNYNVTSDWLTLLILHTNVSINVMSMLSIVANLCLTLMPHCAPYVLLIVEYVSFN